MTTLQKKYPEDVVQEAYFRVATILAQGQELKFETYSLLERYFFKTIKGIIINEAKSKTIQELPIKQDIVGEIPEEIDVVEYSELVKKIDEVVETFYWYDKKMFNLYRYQIPSIRKISSETKISRPSVTQTIESCKMKIQKRLATEYYKIAI
jgi:RNA polymerase sigma factor (sigma-70 family)